jgi:hypothetical protein
MSQLAAQECVTGERGTHPLAGEVHGVALRHAPTVARHPPQKRYRGTPREELLRAVRAAYRGEAVLSAAVAGLGGGRGHQRGLLVPDR